MPIRVESHETFPGIFSICAVYTFPNGPESPDTPLPWLLPSGEESSFGQRKLCPVCRRLNFDYLFEVSTFDMPIPAQTVPQRHTNTEATTLWGGICLGTVVEIRGRSREADGSSGCLFCRLILGLLCKKEPFSADSAMATRVHLRSFFRGPNGTFSNRSQLHAGTFLPGVQLQLALQVGNRQPQSAFEIPMLQRIWQNENRANSDTSQYHLAGGHRLPRSDASFETFKKWISECASAKTGASSLGDRQQRPNIRLIDVERGCLTEIQEDCPHYVALSYVWGQSKNLMLITDNKAGLKEPGALTADNMDIPKTIRDAIVTCHRLGERYLWVDSVCIQQDSPTKMAMISQMDIIYGSAKVTVVALCGSDADSGLPGAAIGSRTDTQNLLQIGEGIVIAPVLPGLLETVESSTWNTRGWTYQERVLSPRKLYFGSEQVYFECPHGITHEDSEENVHVHANHEVDMHHATHRQLQIGHSVDFHDRLNLSVYEDVVRDYTTRSLTKEEDILNAFAGVSNVLQSNLFLGSPVLFGVPMCNISTCLLWLPFGNLQPRLWKEKDDGSRVYFPSWSWMGWKGWGGDASLPPYQGADNLAERVRTSVEWLCAQDEEFLPTGWTDMAPPDWPHWTNWARRVDENDVGYYTTASCGRHKRFSQPLSLYPQKCRYPVNEKTGRLHLRCEISQLRVDGTHTGRWNQEEVCIRDEHSQGTCQLWVYDGSGIRCGVVYVSGFFYVKMGFPVADNTVFDFVKLSQQTYSVGRSDPAWDVKEERYRGIPGSAALNPQDPLGPEDEIFDQTAYDADVCWCLYNVLLVQWEDNVAFRVGIGQVHIHAFDKAQPIWKSIKLG